MKAILISIKPKWVAKILNGEKTIEIRKTMPKCDLPIDVYIYCTKDPTCKLVNMEHYLFGNPTNALRNGKVVAKFTLRKVEHFEYDTCSRDICGYWLDNGQVFNIKKTCLTNDEMFAYIGGKDGYAWHIEDLVIFDKPKGLTWFRETTIDYDFVGKPYHPFIKKAPQSYCYIEVE